MTFKHAISWFEIPTLDLQRAQQFYETIFGIQMIPLELDNLQMRMFPVEGSDSVGGALTFNAEFFRPSETDGPLIYLNGNPDLQKVLDKTESAGGRILVPKTRISADYGFMAVIIDTEGNRVGLHSLE